VLRGDGSMLALDTDELAAPAGAMTRHYAVWSGTHVAVVQSWSLFPSGQRGSSISLFGTDGALRWRHDEPHALVGDVFVAPDGSIVITREHEDTSIDGAIVDGEGAPIVLADFWPGALPLASGFVPGRRTSGDANVPGWFDIAAASFQPVSSTPAASWQLHRGGDIVYLTDGGVVVESPDVANTISLRGFGDVTLSGRAGEWLLFHTDDGSGFARVSFAGVVEAVDLTLPAGLDVLECYTLQPGIDADGRLLVPTRDASVAQLRRLDPRNGTAEPIGFPVTRVDNMDAQTVGGTYVVRADGFNTTFCPTQEWAPAPDALSGTVLQIVRASSGTAHVLPEDAFVLGTDGDGACAAYSDLRGTTRLLDVESGETYELGAIASVAFEQQLP
jgi:hypothetical protein